MNKSISISVYGVIIGISMTLIAARVAAQVPDGCLRHSDGPVGQNGPPTPGQSSVVYQQFPTSWNPEPQLPAETSWFVTFDHAPGRALFLTGAYFKPSPERDWVQVLGWAGISELFVPYQSGSPRFFDLSYGFDLTVANDLDKGRCGQIVGREQKVVFEVVEKLPLWKNDQRVMRGQKMLLWGTLDAANYNYVVLYEFHDDGTIKFRIAGTAENRSAAAFEPHTHNALWRVDVNLNGAEGDSVRVLRHLETEGNESWDNVSEPFNGGSEGPLNFVATEFTQVQVVDERLRNARDKTTSFDLRPIYRGVVRHAEEFMRNDFWATVSNPAEQDFRSLRDYVSNEESIVNANIVLWHVTPLLHVPRSEDGLFIDGYWHGVALAMWGGFDLRPRDLFDGTPFYP